MDNFKAVENMVREAERHADAMSADRIRAIEYYRGEMKDTPSDTGRSSMVTKDVRAHIKKVLPSIMRTIMGRDEVVEYAPVGEGDEAAAQQASDYMNFVVMEESGARTAIRDAIHDALLLRNGIIKWWWDEKTIVKISKHTGLSEDALNELVATDDVEVLEHSSRPEVVEVDGQAQQVLTHDAKIRRSIVERKIKVAAVPRERFLIHPDAVMLADSLLIGDKTTLRRSDLVAMGYDLAAVNELSIADDDEREARATTEDADEFTKSNEEIDYYDLFVRIDMDGDGISELRRMCYAGGLGKKNLLVDEECDEVQFCDLKVMTQPHQWEGISLADDLMDIQRGKTVLLRETLDNIYWQNKPQPIMDERAIVNPDAVFNPEFGLPIHVRQGVDVRAALGFNHVPFVAKDSFGMMEYLDQEAQDRTGVTDASAGMAPDALQNMTAKASAMIEQLGIGQTELMVRTIADGLQDLFRGLLRLTIRHQDAPRMIRLRKEWVQVDPRDWNAEMDCTVNTGLGAGTRERDMVVMQQVLGLQQAIIQGFGADNPYVKPDNLWNSLSKLIESAGLKTPTMYFTEPDPKEVKKRMEDAKNKPSPEMEKIKAQAQADAAKLQLQAKTDAARAESDFKVAMAKIEAEMQLKREQIAAEMQLKREQMLAELQLKREQAQSLGGMAPGGAATSGVRFGGEVG